jgi:hypothetical protein
MILFLLFNLIVVVILLKKSLFRVFLLTRTKTSIRYAKENDREKREREGEREGCKGYI